MQPDDDSLLEQANRLLEDGKPQDALRLLDELDIETLDDQERVEWGSLRAWALTEMGRDDEALETLEPLLDEFPQSARLLGTLGVVLSNRDDLEQARDVLEEAVELAPEDEVALANLALVYEKLRDYERAAALYDRALSLGADIDWILLRKAAALTELGQYNAAKTTLKRYLSLIPDDAAQWIALALLHSDDGEFAAAFECYAQAERLDPNAPMLRLNWGVTAVRAGKLKVARAQLRQLQRIEPRSTRPWLLRAFILEAEGHWAAACAIYERILARRHFADRSELNYALEMAMDFFARHKLRERCERVLAQAYTANACTVELCEAYREVAGEHVERAYWFSILLEADYRPGLCEIRTAGRRRSRRCTRFERTYQTVARDRDEAVSMLLSFTRRMGETNVVVREFVGEEPLEDTYTGLYEVEPDAYVFDPEQ